MEMLDSLQNVVQYAWVLLVLLQKPLSDRFLVGGYPPYGKKFLPLKGFTGSGWVLTMKISRQRNTMSRIFSGFSIN